MIIAYLVIGFFGAVLSTGFALASGFGILAAIGFYIWGGVFTTLGAALLTSLVFDRSAAFSIALSKEPEAPNAA